MCERVENSASRKRYNLSETARRDAGVALSHTKAHRSIRGIVEGFLGNSVKSAEQILADIKAKNARNNPRNNAINNPIQSKKDKELRHQVAVEWAKENDVNKWLFTSRLLTKRKKFVLNDLSIPQLGGQSLSDALSSKSWMIYFGTTCRALKKEGLRFLSARGRNVEAQRETRSKSVNRPVLKFADGRTITWSRAMKELNGFSVVVDIRKLRLAACQLEDSLQTFAHGLGLPYRLHRALAKGRKNDKVIEGKEIYKTYVTGFKINFFYKPLDWKRRPKFVNVNGVKLQICY